MIEVLEEICPVSDLCAALDVSRAGFYFWRQRDPSERERADTVLGAEIDVLFVRHRRTYGSPRLPGALRRAGHACDRHRVAPGSCGARDRWESARPSPAGHHGQRS